MTTVRRLAAIALVLASGLTQAATFADPQWQTLLDDRRTAELEQRVLTRLKDRPGDPQGVLGALWVAMLEPTDARLERAVAQAEGCVQREAGLALCHYALGSAVGLQAMRAGAFGALRLAGRSKEALVRAVELDPLHFPSRDALQQFYLAAPGIAGGSVAKARELAQQAQARQPEHARLLQAKLALHDKQWDEAQRLLAAVRPGDDTELQDALRETWGATGAVLLRERQPARARAVFERLQQLYPGHALGFYGLGRVLAEGGAPADGLAQYERARALKLADRYPIDYRAALAWLAQGDPARARPLLERFVAAGKGPAANLEDARKRLAQLR